MAVNKGEQERGPRFTSVYLLQSFFKLTPNFNVFTLKLSVLKMKTTHISNALIVLYRLHQCLNAM